MISRKDILAHLQRDMRTGFLRGQRAYTPLRTRFAGRTSSDAAFESYGDMGATPWPVQNAGKQGAGGTDAKLGTPVTNQMSMGQQIQILGGEERSITVYNIDWEIAIGITHNAIDDDKAGDIEGWAMGASANFEKHKDYQCFLALNAGEATTNFGACYDGQPLFSASHADPGAVYSTAQSNLFSVALGLDNFETVKIAASKFKDGTGNPIGFTHSLLIVPSDLERVAAQISTNREAYDTANREVNPYQGNISVLVAPGGWLDTTAWFLLDTSMPQKPLYLQMRKEAELTEWDDEKAGDGGVHYFKWHARYSVFYGDWRLVVQGNS